MGDVTKNIVQPLLTMYGEPNSENIEAVYDIYDKVLNIYADEVLAAALAKVIGEFYPGKRFPWPAPALINRAAQSILAKTTRPVSTWPIDIDQPVPNRTPQELERVAAMMANFKRIIASRALGIHDPDKVARSKRIADRMIGEGE